MESQIKQEHGTQCIAQLENLLARIRKTVQNRTTADFLNKYIIDFQISQPRDLIGGTLQQHQLEALQWMINLGSQNSNAVLADDMGLGKTIQAISYMAYLKEQRGIKGKHLILCPKSVSLNWIRQINKWMPSIEAHLFVNTKNGRDQFMSKIFRPRKFDVLVATYQGARNFIMPLSRIKWQILVVDQAHKIKNDQSQNFIALSYLKANFKLLLTGTPLSNNLRELWSLMNFIMPQLFDDRDLFDRIEDSANQISGSQEQKFTYQIKVASFFHQIIGPFFKRRTKKQLQLGLPPKTQKTLYVPLTKQQLKMYKNFLKYGNVIGDMNNSNYHHMFARKICNHPYLFDQTTPQDSQEYSNNLINSCGKLKVLDKLLTKLISEKHKVLIFSQFTMMLDILVEYCDTKNFYYCRLDGNTSLEERQMYMQDFNNTHKYDIFLLSTKAGGLGINLIGADRVIIYDVDWNPQNDIQAMDRAYRIGQKNAVQVYRLVTEHTIEERMIELQRYKLIWDQLVIQKGGFFGKKDKDNPFLNINYDNLASLGKGDIFRLQNQQQDKTIQQILALGQIKDKEQGEAIKQKLMKNLQNKEVINPFLQKQEECEQIKQYQSDMFFKRKFDHQKRQKLKFEKIRHLPAFKFYTYGHKIRQLQFELHMENKMERPDQKLIKYLEEEIKNTKNKGKFEHWCKEEFDLFVEAHKLYFKKDYQHISKHIITKTEEEVKIYSEYYFDKAPNSQYLIESLRQIELGQSRLRNDQKKLKEQLQKSQKQLIQLKRSKTNQHNQNEQSKSNRSSKTQDKLKKKKTQNQIKEEKLAKQAEKEQKRKEAEQKKKQKQEELKMKEQLKQKREQQKKEKQLQRQRIIEQNKKKRQEELERRLQKKKEIQEQKKEKQKRRIQIAEEKKRQLEEKKIESQILMNKKQQIKILQKIDKKARESIKSLIDDERKRASIELKRNEEDEVTTNCEDQLKTQELKLQIVRAINPKNKCK